MRAVSGGQPRRSSPRGRPAGSVRAVLRAADGVQIEAIYEPCAAGKDVPCAAGKDEPGSAEMTGSCTADVAGDGGPAADGSGDASTRPVIVVAHGFTGSVDRPAVRRVAEVFSREAAVVTFSFRGHGASGGRSTVGDKEVLDLAEAVAWGRSFGHRRAMTVGFSMGGSVVLRHAALYRDDPRARTDAVVSVSGPARWYYRGTAPMRRMHWLVTRRFGRVIGRYGLHTRIYQHDWDPVPLSPVEAVPQIPPTPLLVVHGDRDPYFPLDHPRMLADAAPAGAAELWIEPHMGHAENAADEDLLGRIAAWLAAH